MCNVAASEYVNLIYDFSESYDDESNRLFYSESFAIYFEMYYKNKEKMLENYPEIYSYMEKLIEVY